ncbi:hypothetical protein [Algoriphagus algorifonticola]|uniref:hypothetical protein n=1 Tax=Algoriphagus algorifonticola TaxID=2593007 RepID=UPI0011A0FBE1|nr:hypothetical protein [Algoriphagus algorifonticola]
MQTDRLIGVVVSFYPDKNYGFIQTQTEDTYFFYQSELNYQADFAEGLILKRYEALIGDLVSFVLRPNFRADDPPIATGLVRMINFDRLKMIEMAMKKEYLVGTLKKLGDEFFVKHRETGAWVKVMENSLYKDPKCWMEERIQYWVKFKINLPKGEEKVVAYLLDIPFRGKVKDLILRIENAQKIEGKVVHRSNAGITVVIKDYYINGNLSIKSARTEEEKEYFNQVKLGDFISAYPIDIDLEKELITLDFFRTKAELEMQKDEKSKMVLELHEYPLSYQ